jgi:lipopolysaccharide export LptBFGC system permease protein LptF
VEWAVLLKTILSFLLSSLGMATPMAIYFSSLYVFSKYSETSEYIAMRSLGYSSFQVLKPLLLITTFISLLLFALNYELIPTSRAFGRSIINVLKSKAILTELKPGAFFTKIPSLIVYAEKIDTDTFLMKDIFIYFSGSDKPYFVQASQGRLHLTKDSSAGKYIELSNGTVYSANGSISQKMMFQKFNYEIPEFGGEFNPQYKPSFLRWTKLGELKTASQDLLKNNVIDVERLIDIQMEPWERAMESIMCLLFAFLGGLMGMGHFRQRPKGKSFIITAIFLSYFIVYYGFLSVAKKSLVPFWFPIAVCLFTMALWSVWVYRRSRWILAS